MATAIEKSRGRGARGPKPGAPDKTIGRTRYINDMVLPRMLIGKIKRTDRVHALIKRIDTAAAEALPGVHAVVTAADTPMIGIGVVKDDPPLKGDKVRCIRDEIAAVAAETDEIADRALALIEIEYEDLPAVFDPAAATGAGAPLIHDDKPGNLGLEYSLKFGDVAKADR